MLAAVKSNLAEMPGSLSYRLESAPGTDVARAAWQATSAHGAAALLRTGDDAGQSERDDAAAFIYDYFTENAGAALARELPAADHDALVM